MKTKLTLLMLIFISSCSEAPRVSEPAVEKVSELEPLKVEKAELIVEPLAPVLKDQNAEFERYIERFLHRYWELNPSHAVYVGYYEFDSLLRVPNGDTRALRREFLVNSLQALKGFDATQLSKSNATDLTIVSKKIKSSLWYIDKFRSFEWNPAQYNVASIFGLILNTDYKPVEERAITILNRLENVPAYYAAAQHNIKSPTLPHLGLAIQQSKGVLGVFNKTIPEKLKDVSLNDENRALLDSRLANASLAISDYITWLENKHLELSEGGTARNFRIGEELYEKKFTHDIVSNYTAAELYAVALEAKNTLHSEMVATTKLLWPSYFEGKEQPQDDLVAVKQMIDLLSKKHISRDGFVGEIRRQIPLIQQFMDDNELLDSDPSRPLVVRLTPEYQRGFAGASVDAPGPYNATANTYYNVSPLDGFSDDQAESYLREYNHWILQILNIHEAIPGHYTQLMHANKSPSKIKAIFSNGAMIEGWAVYSERMMLEEGYGGNEPEMWLMYSKWNLRVVVNTILDYSIQVLGMEEEQALNLLMNEAFQERTEAEGKWRRATVSQVQLTSYFTGYSEIYAFRNEVKALEGDEFNLKAFHNKFLSYGNAPVPLIRALMLEEISQKSELVGEPVLN